MKTDDVTELSDGIENVSVHELFGVFEVNVIVSALKVTWLLVIVAVDGVGVGLQFADALTVTVPFTVGFDRFPPESSAQMIGSTASGCPEIAAGEGWVVTTNCVAAPATTWKVWLVTVPRPEALKVRV